MNNPDFAIPVREPSQTGLDDTIQPFAVEALDLRGRIVRLGAAVDTILTSHDYPAPVAKLPGTNKSAGPRPCSAYSISGGNSDMSELLTTRRAAQAHGDQKTIEQRSAACFRPGRRSYPAI